jgi:hypothetical protein
MSDKDHRHSIVAGVPLVTIPLSDYASLLDCKRQLAERAISHDQVMSPARSVIERNPEVAVFLAQNFGLKSMETILRLCRRQFGKDRTPSRSAAYRYWERLRKEASKRP